MKLYLVQHGEALSKDIDPGRPLSRQGEDDVGRVAVFLEQARVSLHTILHSGKMRAHQTADILAEALLLQRGETRAIEGIAPNDSVEDFAARLGELKHDTMVVGHLPFLAGLVACLVGGRDEPAPVAYRPGGVVCLQRDEAGHWQILWMLRPDLLPG